MGNEQLSAIQTNYAIGKEMRAKLKNLAEKSKKRSKLYEKSLALNRCINVQAKQLKRIFQLQRGECCYCTRKLTVDNIGIEHISPRAYGGRNTTDNVALACFSCNNMLGVLHNTQLGSAVWLRTLDAFHQRQTETNNGNQ